MTRRVEQMRARLAAWCRLNGEPEPGKVPPGPEPMRDAGEAYREYLGTPHWQKMRRLVIDRDGGICRGCLQAEAVHVHHVSYDNKGAEFGFELIALCGACHRRLHGKDTKEDRR